MQFIVTGKRDCMIKYEMEIYLFVGVPHPQTSILSNLYGIPQCSTCWKESSTWIEGFLGSLPALMPLGYPRIDVFRYMDFGPPLNRKKTIRRRHTSAQVKGKWKLIVRRPWWVQIELDLDNYFQARPRFGDVRIVHSVVILTVNYFVMG